MKICLDCKHCSYKEPSFFYKIFPKFRSWKELPSYSHCFHETALINESIDKEYLVVGGEPIKNFDNYRLCRTMRSYEYGWHNKKFCGESGRYWEPK
jgi:hypothetical protein